MTNFLGIHIYLSIYLFDIQRHPHKKTVAIPADVKLSMVKTTMIGDGKEEDCCVGRDAVLRVLLLPSGSAHTCSLLKDSQRGEPGS